MMEKLHFKIIKTKEELHRIIASHQSFALPKKSLSNLQFLNQIVDLL
jgi:RNAse (barnase) inhibitor barstar